MRDGDAWSGEAVVKGKEKCCVSVDLPSMRLGYKGKGEVKDAFRTLSLLCEVPLAVGTLEGSQIWKAGGWEWLWAVCVWGAWGIPWCRCWLDGTMWVTGSWEKRGEIMLLPREKVYREREWWSKLLDNYLFYWVYTKESDGVLGGVPGKGFVTEAQGRENWSHVGSACWCVRCSWAGE